jgi:cyclopropane fatty-acyl-phospholipid synthase-like methyltransferase
MIEFSQKRAEMYAECLAKYPDARVEDIELLERVLPMGGEDRVLEVGAGSGFFSRRIAERVRELVVLDPSPHQLQELDQPPCPNIRKYLGGAEDLQGFDGEFDAVWSFGAFHHVPDKDRAFSRFSDCLCKGGLLVIADVFQGSNLAQHFDSEVSRFCLTGHDVEFLTHEQARYLCTRYGFSMPELEDVNLKWHFASRQDIGDFLYLLHAMTKSNRDACLTAAERILGVEKMGAGFALNWPMTVMKAHKL